MLRCLTLSAEADSRKIEDISAHRQWIDAVEVRLDLCEHADEGFLSRVLEVAGQLAVILTYRRQSDGGGRKIDETRRLQTLTDLLRPGVDYVDIEYGLTAPQVKQRAAEVGAELIRSLHDFEGVPSKMSALIEEISAAGEIPKIACYPKSSVDVLKLMNTVAATAHIRKKIVLGMGGFGFFTRTAPLLCGSMLTFCAAGSRKGAPGQIGPAELEQIYRVSAQDKNTVYYGIIGNPVLHSKSPVLHNKWFEEQEMNAVYLPFQVDDVGLFMKLAEQIDLRGFSVTVPHKQSIIAVLDKVDQTVQVIGACNTVVHSRSGWKGSNTDYEGFLAPLRERGLLQSGVRVLVVGAGGVARTVVYALKEAGANITLVNRTDARASALAEEFGVNWRSIRATWNEADTSDTSKEAARFQLIVQTSSAGMEPDTEADPLPGYRFSGSEIVYELIYAPVVTRFLQRASEAGCITIGGSEMLTAQGVLQFKKFCRVYRS